MGGKSVSAVLRRAIRGSAKCRRIRRRSDEIGRPAAMGALSRKRSSSMRRTRGASKKPEIGTHEGLELGGPACDGIRREKRQVRFGKKLCVSLAIAFV